MLLILNILFELIVFHKCLGRIIPYMGLLDEIVVIIISILTIIKIIKDSPFQAIIEHFRENRMKGIIKKIKGFELKGLIKQELLIVLTFSIFLILGIVSTLIYRVQPQLVAVFKDILAISKFIICYLGMLILTQEVDKDLLLTQIIKRSKIYIIIIFIFSIINLFFNIGMHYDVRFGLRSYQFLFPHPTYLVASLSILLVVVGTKSRKISIVEILALSTLMLTFRSKALVFIMVYLASKFILKYIGEIKIKHIAIVGCLGFLLSFKKIISVFKYGYTAARPALYLVGIKLANDYFPLGSGMGTFASSLSGEYYSPIYEKYSINHVMGLTQQSYNYMADTFWPYVYGQYGYIGFIIFLATLYFIFKSLKLRYENKNLNCSMAIYIYILIASVAEAIFTDSTGTFMFIVLATYLGNNLIDNMNIEENEELK